jgi:hypothetical protein
VVRIAQTVNRTDGPGTAVITIMTAANASSWLVAS